MTCTRVPPPESGGGALGVGDVDLSNDPGVDLTEVDANTVAGLILFELQSFPEIGEVVVRQGVKFTVLDRDERRITLVSVERDPAAV